MGRRRIDGPEAAEPRPQNEQDREYVEPGERPHAAARENVQNPNRRRDEAHEPGDGPSDRKVRQHVQRKDQDETPEGVERGCVHVPSSCIKARAASRARLIASRPQRFVAVPPQSQRALLRERYGIPLALTAPQLNHPYSVWEATAVGKHRKFSLVSALGAIAVVAIACEPPAAPEEADAVVPELHILPDEKVACFRLTGGGRIDKPEPATVMAQPKNTPQSHDFATFGFQARPVACNTSVGSGQLEWVDHNPGAPLGGFSFHSPVNWFVEVEDHYGPTGDPKDGCGRFSGNDGRVHGRDGSKHEPVPFVVEHGCDRGEPGVGNDHIRICIGTAEPDECKTGFYVNGGAIPYRRAGILTGGNIQKHKV